MMSVKADKAFVFHIRIPYCLGLLICLLTFLGKTNPNALVVMARAEAFDVLRNTAVDPCQGIATAGEQLRAVSKAAVLRKPPAIPPLDSPIRSSHDSSPTDLRARRLSAAGELALSSIEPLRRSTNP